jgi:hypothetical protein
MFIRVVDRGELRKECERFKVIDVNDCSSMSSSHVIIIITICTHLYFSLSHCSLRQLRTSLPWTAKESTLIGVDNGPKRSKVTASTTATTASDSASTKSDMESVVME